MYSDLQHVRHLNNGFECSNLDFYVLTDRLFWASSAHYIPVGFILIFYSHLCLGIPSGIFFSVKYNSSY